MSATPIPQSDNAETTAFVDAVQNSIRDADEGRKRPYSEVRRWLLSWGTDNEKPTPQRG